MTSASEKGAPFYGWVVVWAAFVVLFFAFGATYSFGAFFSSLEGAFGATRGEVSLVFAISGFLYFWVGMAAGVVSDRIGPKPVIVFGMAVAGLGIAAASLAEALWQVYIAYGIGIGLGVGCAYIPAAGAVQKWFVARRGRASGIALAGIGVGTLLGPIAAGWLIAMDDWRLGFLGIGLATMICGTLVAFLIEGDPAKRGTGPDGVPLPPAPPAGDMPIQRPTFREGLRLARASRAFAMIWVAYFLVSFGNFVPLVHLVPYAEDRGIGIETSVLLLSLIGIGSTVGRFLLGGVADRFGRRQTLAAAFAGVGLSCLIWLASDQFWQLAIFALVMGTFYGGFVALGPAVTADYFDVRIVTIMIGLLYSGVGIGNLVAPTFAGYAFDLWQSYTVPIVVSVVTGVLAGLLVYLAPDPDRA